MTESSGDPHPATDPTCCRCGGPTIAPPWCADCRFAIEGSEIDPGSEQGPEVQHLFGRLLDMYADHRLEILPEVFTAFSEIRYPQARLSVTGIEAIQRWYGAAFELAPKLTLDHVYADIGSVWALYSVRFEAAGLTGSSAGISQAAPQAYAARFELRDGRIEAMDVYPLNRRRSSSPAVVPAPPTTARAGGWDVRSPGSGAIWSSGRARNLRRGRCLRSLLPVVGVVAIVGSLVAALLPNLNASTGVNAAVGFGAANAAGVAGGVVVLVLYAALRRLTPGRD